MVRPITDKELRIVLAILIIGKQENGTMEFRDWYKNRVQNAIFRDSITLFMFHGNISDSMFVKIYIAKTIRSSLSVIGRIIRLGDSIFVLCLSIRSFEYRISSLIKFIKMLPI